MVLIFECYQNNFWPIKNAHIWKTLMQLNCEFIYYTLRKHIPVKFEAITIFIQENEFGNVIYKVVAILFLPQCVNLYANLFI